jgi:hypothetical protein
MRLHRGYYECSLARHGSVSASLFSLTGVRDKLSQIVAALRRVNRSRAADRRACHASRLSSPGATRGLVTRTICKPASARLGRRDAVGGQDQVEGDVRHTLRGGLGLRHCVDLRERGLRLGGLRLGGGNRDAGLAASSSKTWNLTSEVSAACAAPR